MAAASSVTGCGCGGSSSSRERQARGPTKSKGQSESKSTLVGRPASLKRPSATAGPSTQLLQTALSKENFKEPLSEATRSALVQALAKRPREQQRLVLKTLRAGGRAAVEQLERQGVRQWVDATLSGPDPEEGAKRSEASRSSQCRTWEDRFDLVSDEISCPQGCAGSIRYGHRVGDVGKYVTMEREAQSTAVLCWCSSCRQEFDAWL